MVISLNYYPIIIWPIQWSLVVFKWSLFVKHIHAVGGGLLTYLLNDQPSVRLPVIVNLIPLICAPGSKHTYLELRCGESVIGKWQTTTKLRRLGSVINTGEEDE